MKRIVALAMAALPAFCLLLPMHAAAEKADRKEKILINAVDGDADHAKGFYDFGQIGLAREIYRRCCAKIDNPVGHVAFSL